MDRDRMTGCSGQDQAGTRLSSALERWIARPRRETNIAAAMWLILAMSVLAVAASRAPEGAAALRYIAMIIAGAHGVQHVVWVGTLRRLRDRGVAKAETALRVYLDPLRITCLDLAMAWVGFGAFVPILFRSVAAVSPSAE